MKNQLKTGRFRWTKRLNYFVVTNRGKWLTQAKKWARENPQKVSPNAHTKHRKIADRLCARTKLHGENSQKIPKENFLKSKVA